LEQKEDGDNLGKRRGTKLREGGGILKEKWKQRTLRESGHKIAAMGKRRGGRGEAGPNTIKGKEEETLWGKETAPTLTITHPLGEMPQMGRGQGMAIDHCDQSFWVVFLSKKMVQIVGKFFVIEWGRQLKLASGKKLMAKMEN
jgi:hypothetical protein